MSFQLADFDLCGAKCLDIAVVEHPIQMCFLNVIHDA